MAWFEEPRPLSDFEPFQVGDVFLQEDIGVTWVRDGESWVPQRDEVASQCP